MSTVVVCFIAWYLFASAVPWVWGLKNRVLIWCFVVYQVEQEPNECFQFTMNAFHEHIFAYKLVFQGHACLGVMVSFGFLKPIC